MLQPPILATFFICTHKYLEKSFTQAHRKGFYLQAKNMLLKMAVFLSSSVIALPTETGINISRRKSDDHGKGTSASTKLIAQYHTATLAHTSGISKLALPERCIQRTLNWAVSKSWLIFPWQCVLNQTYSDKKLFHWSVFSWNVCSSFIQTISNISIQKIY